MGVHAYDTHAHTHTHADNRTHSLKMQDSHSLSHLPWLAASEVFTVVSALVLPPNFGWLQEESSSAATVVGEGEDERR